jgi:ABC-type phosphate transport system substrate-binding protein
MKKIIYTLAIALTFIFVTTFTVHAQISIVVSKSSSHKGNLDEMKQIFCGAKIAWENGNKVQVADQAESEIGKKFYDKFIGKSAIQVRSQWMKLVLSGQAAAPIKCTDDTAVKKAVAENPNAVGYILSSSVDATVKEIGKIE